MALMSLSWSWDEPSAFHQRAADSAPQKVSRARIPAIPYCQGCTIRTGSPRVEAPQFVVFDCEEMSSWVNVFDI